MCDVAPWARVVVERVEGAPIVLTLVGDDPPDLGVVDGLVRLTLTARRAGASLRLEAACPHLQELLEMTGLGVEMEG